MTYFIYIYIYIQSIEYYMVVKMDKVKYHRVISYGWILQSNNKGKKSPNIKNIIFLLL